MPGPEVTTPPEDMQDTTTGHTAVKTADPSLGPPEPRQLIHAISSTASSHSCGSEGLSFCIVCCFLR